MRFLPVSLLDDAPEAVFITDESGRIEYLNVAAVRVLGCEPESVVGKRCRQAGFRLQTIDGRAFCSPRSCPIQRMMLRGHPPHHPVEVILVRCGGSSVDATLESFAISPPEGGGVAILHRLLVHEAGRDADGPAPTLRAAEARLSRLSRRETEVLRKLATGLQTDEVAEALFISHETVRNHVRHILDKLGVHHRIDAVVAWIVSRERAQPPTPSASNPDRSSSGKEVPAKK